MNNNKKPGEPLEPERWAKIEKEVQELKRSRSILSIGLFLLSGLYGILILCIILRIIRIEDTLTSIIQFNALVGEHLQSLGDSLIRMPNFLRCNRAVQSCAPNWKSCSRIYQISAHGTTCALCAPYEGRVYSRSGKDPDFPPLSDAFGKMDPAGPDDLSNSWLNIHPNCLHSLRPWTPAGRTPEELERIRRFSSPKTNPYSRDPRTEAQIKAYRDKEQGRAKWLAQYRQWERYRTALGDEVPKTFATFQRHKLAGDEKYQGWVSAYRDRQT